MNLKWLKIGAINMYWNNRIVRKVHGERGKDGKLVDPDNEYNEAYYGIHEVYYDHNDKACMVSQEAEPLYGETVTELINNWLEMVDAFNKPILDFDEIPEEGAHNEIDESLKELQDEDGNIRPTEELIAEGKLITHEVVVKELREKLREKAEDEGNLDEFNPDWLDDGFDMKEYRNEQVVEQNKEEKRFFDELVGKSKAEVIAHILENYGHEYDDEIG
jgi:hypothetical protein